MVSGESILVRLFAIHKSPFTMLNLHATVDRIIVLSMGRCSVMTEPEDLPDQSNSIQLSGERRTM